MSKHPVLVAIVLAAAIGGPSLLAHLVATSDRTTPSAPGAVNDDDGWRLTIAGWERVRTSESSVSISAVRPQHGRTEQSPALGKADTGWDLHPATLALLLVLGATTAFCLFPNESSVASRRSSETLF